MNTKIMDYGNNKKRWCTVTAAVQQFNCTTIHTYIIHVRNHLVTAEPYWFIGRMETCTVVLSARMAKQ